MEKSKHFLLGQRINSKEVMVVFDLVGGNARIMYRYKIYKFVKVSVLVSPHD